MSDSCKVHLTPPSKQSLRQKQLSVVTPRTLRGYVYDPNEVNSVEIQIDDEDHNTENRIEDEAVSANDLQTQLPLKTGGEQMKLFDTWRKKTLVYLYL
ncbi:hypothetical protein I4U23_000081 [Adineta vaga]|nr:hypothetical protein I4U23_000081 [Adineta vaga]